MKKEKTVNEDLLVWLDLETTGLSEHSDSILEIGMVISTMNGDILDECSWVTTPVKRSAQDATKFEKLKIDKIKEWAPEAVLEMHTKNGLWDELEATNMTLFDAGKQIPEWLTMNGLDIKNELFYMAGNGVDRFDRKFLETNHIPLRSLNTLFHYRSLDVSNLFQAFRFTGIDLNAHRPSRGETTHRAVDDCKWGIEDWQWFRAITNTAASR